jgi:hypothetical protein
LYRVELYLLLYNLYLAETRKRKHFRAAQVKGLNRRDENMPKASKKGAPAPSIENADVMELGDLYDKIDAERKVRKSGQASVSADQIREYRDELFAAGKDKISVATLKRLVDLKFGLEKTEDGDTRVQNSSIRSAVEKGDYEIIKEGNVAYIVRKA